MRLARLVIPFADLSIVGSFGAGGYRLRSPDFDPIDLDRDLRGQAHVITGATSGLGFAAAQTLAAKGATVVLVGRDEAKLARAVAAVPGALGERCDMADLSAVRGLCDRLETRFSHISSLTHNAGLIASERMLTAEGHESVFVVHVLAPFLMSHRLEHLLVPNGRLVWVSSGGMYSQKLDLEKARALSGPYDGVRAYAQHKRAQVLLSELFARRFATRALGASPTSNAMHPGWVDTPGVERGIPAFHRRMARFLRTPDQGADTVVWLCIAPSVAGTSGKFFLDREARRTQWFPWTRHSETDREALWDLCCAHTGVEAPYPAKTPAA